MAKTATKQNGTSVNPRSRAAKRETSPSINVDKSIKEAPRALGASPALGVSHGSGISKKKKTKQMTRSQRARQEKGLARAEAVMDQMEKKVDTAKDRLKKRHQRKALWDDVNETATDEQRKVAKVPGWNTKVEENKGQENEPAHDENEKDIDMESTRFEVLIAETPTTLQQQSVPTVEEQPSSTIQQDELDLIT